MRQTVKRIHQGGCYYLPYFNTMARTVFGPFDTGIIQWEKE